MDVGIFVPIAAIVMGVGAGMLRIWTRHQQEMAQIRSTQQVQSNSAESANFEALRRELAQLRDTTTQYDMSVENALGEIKQRLENVESKTQTPYRSPTQDEPPVQSVGYSASK